MVWNAKTLLLTTAVLEGGIAVALLLAPSFVVLLLLGEGLSTPTSFVLARVAAGALIALASASWLARASTGARAIAMGLLLYNGVTAIVLAHAGLALGLSGIGLWPIVIIHVAMAAWCGKCAFTTA
jgi:hypothetical protein